MTLKEYESVKHLTYLGYCDYLQKKYGIAVCNYMNPTWTKNRGVSRTKEGLYAHHKYEDHAILLSHTDYARRNPYQWQAKENIVYCNLLEHLYLHILICEYPAEDANKDEFVGVGGVVNFFVPELNDVYSGYTSKQRWQTICHNAIINNKDTYLALIKRFKNFYNGIDLDKILCKSFNAQFGTWPEENNYELYHKIMEL